MDIIRDGKKYTLTNQELSAAFYEQQKEFYFEDATNKVFEEAAFLADDDEQSEALGYPEFTAKYGVSVEDAINRSSKSCLLKDMVDYFYEWDDANISELALWNSAFLYAVENK